MATTKSNQDKDASKPEVVQEHSAQAPTGATVASPAPAPAPAPVNGDGLSAQQSNDGSADPKPEKLAYQVTGRTDVLHNGDLYAEGDTVWLDQASARPLLKNGCIKPKDAY
ncbi:hypothetical protein [Pseudomonas monteilii]|uniref:hypothetical protein n=1 Tax=Pseudomonas monteilii TaxID=76759 RepID=UPI000F747D05|nr:hypothetical protein [Pseudomonas monteilii]